ncbi:MAG: hypothetical protein ACKOCN_09165 [Planctomycetaceae bacterium]
MSTTNTEKDRGQYDRMGFRAVRLTRRGGLVGPTPLKRPPLIEGSIPENLKVARAVRSVMFDPWNVIGHPSSFIDKTHHE